MDHLLILCIEKFLFVLFAGSGFLWCDTTACESSEASTTLSISSLEKCNNEQPNSRIPKTNGDRNNKCTTTPEHQKGGKTDNDLLKGNR